MHRRSTRALIASALVALLACPLSTAARADAAAGVSAVPFGPQSFWRTSLESAPIDAASQAMVDRLVSTITDRYSGVAAFNAHQFNSPLYTAAAGAATVDFAYDDCQGKGHTPSGLLGPGGQFTGVPLPADAVPATGSDAELSVYSPASDQLWEFWKARKRTDGSWSACWGGRLDQVSTTAGHFSGTFGATASGLPNAGGLVRLAEIRAGRITHAMSLAIPSPAIWTSFRWPAQRSDGSDTDPAALPEGSRLRLDPGIDLSKAGLTPAGLTIARAAQQYGFIVVDKSGAASVLAEAVPAVGSAPDPWRQLLGTPDYAVMKNFPWSRLQVVADGWRGPTATTTSTAAPAARIDAVAASAPAPAAAVTTAARSAVVTAVPTDAVVAPAAPGTASGGTGAAAPTSSSEADRPAVAQRVEQRVPAAKQAAAKQAAAKQKAAAAKKAKARKAAAKRAAIKKAAAQKAAKGAKARKAVAPHGSSKRATRASGGTR